MSLFVWTPRALQGRPDPNRCCVSVSSKGGRFFSHQCGRKITVRRVFEGKDRGFCKQHDPEVVKARWNEREARWKRESDAREAAYQYADEMREAQARAVRALEQIRDGHNDPRELARETLSSFPTKLDSRDSNN